MARARCFCRSCRLAEFARLNPRGPGGQCLPFEFPAAIDQLHLSIAQGPHHHLAACQNPWDWLGHGYYFWEDSPARAMRWAKAESQRRASKIIQICVRSLDQIIGYFWPRFSGLD